MEYRNKRLFASILLGILFSILFASAIDSQSAEEKSIASIPLIQPVSAQQSSPLGTDVSIPQGTSVPGCQESNECFLPASITIKVGDTVSWTNDDTAYHTVTSGTFSAGPDGIFDSSMIMSGDTFSVAFDRDGTYPYYCKLHPWQTGYVIVERGDTISPEPEPTPSETKYLKLNADEFILPITRGMTTEVMINGYVEDYSRGVDVYLIIENPNGEIETQKLIASRGDYTTRIYLQHDSQLGEYKITTKYRGVNVDTISFVVIDKSSVKPSTAEPAPEPVEAPPSFSEGMKEGMKLFEEMLSDTGICEGLLSVDEVKTAIGYTGELESMFMTMPANPQDPGLENVCFGSFFNPLGIESGIVFTLLAYDSAEHVIEKFTTMSQSALEGSELEMKEGVSETGWKFISGEGKLGLGKESKESSPTSMTLSQKDRYLVMVGSYQPEGDEQTADLPQLHEVAKIVWEKMDKKISTVSEAVKEKVPGWIKNNAKWWSEGQIGDSDFVGGIQFMIKEKIINIPDLPEQASETAEEKVPDWIRNNAGWWADGQISEDDFVNGIKYLVEKGIIRV